MILHNQGHANTYLIWHYWYWKPNSIILHPFQFSFFTICITIIRFFLAFLCLQSHLGISAGNVVNWWPAHGFVALKVQVKIQTLMMQSFHFTHPQGPKNRQNMRLPFNVYKVVSSKSKIPVCLNKQCKSKWWKILTSPLMKPQIRKVPFIYYVRTTCIVQNLIWLPNFSQNCLFFVKVK